MSGIIRNFVVLLTASEVKDVSYLQTIDRGGGRYSIIHVSPALPNTGGISPCYRCYTHHNEPVLRPLSHVVAALGPSQLALGLGSAGLAVVCHLVTISGAASPPPGHMSHVTCHMSQ